MKLAGNRSGRIRVSTLLLLVALAAGGYCGLAFGTVWWHRYRIQDALDQQLSFVGQISDDAIRDRLVARLRELHLPAAARAVRVSRSSPRSLEVAIRYTETVNLLFTEKRIPVSIRKRRTY